MDLRNLLGKVLYNCALLFFITLTSPTAFAFSEFVNAQSPQHIAALIYGLLGLMTILFITPLLQFYVGAARAVNYKQALDVQTRALDAANTGIVYLREDGTIYYANETAITLLGSAQRNVINQTFIEYIQEGAREEVKRALTREHAQISVQVEGVNSPITLHFGEWLKYANTPFLIITLVSDANASKSDPPPDTSNNELSQTTHALQAAEQQLQQLINLAPVGIGTLNSRHEILSANDNLIERLKYNAQALKQGNIYKLFTHAEEASLSARELQEHNQIHGLHVELTTRDGESAPTELTVDLFDTDRDEYLFWMVNYCDEQFQYDKFNALLEHSGVAVALLTDAGFSKLNRTAYSFLKIESNSNINDLSPSSLTLNHSKEDALELATLIDTIRQKGGMKSLRWSHRINGEAVPCELTLVPVYKNNKLDAIMCIWTDLRELEHAGAALRTTTSKLEHTDARLAQVEREYAAASAKNEALEGELAALKADLERVKEQEAAFASQVSQSQHEPEHALDLAKSKITSLEALLTERNKKITVMELNREAEQSEVSALLSQIDNLKQSVYQKEQANEVLEYHLERLESEQENATTFINRLTEQLTEQRKSSEQAEQKIQLLAAQSESGEMGELQTQLATLASDHAQEKQRLLDARAEENTELVRTKAALEKAQQHVSELSHASAQLELENNQHTALIDNLMSQVSTLTQESRQHKQTTLEVQRELETQRRAQQVAQSQCSNAEHELMRLKQHLADVQEQKQNAEDQLSGQQQKEQKYRAEIRAAQAEQELLRNKLREAKKQTEALTQLAKNHKAPHTVPPSSSVHSRPDIESIVLPNRPVSWFDLNYFWANQPSDYRLSLSLNALLDEIDNVIRHGDEAIQSEKIAEMSSLAQQLLNVSKTINAGQLIDLAQSFTSDCRQGMKDNARVRWQPTKHALQQSQRVVYEQLQHI